MSKKDRKKPPLQPLVPGPPIAGHTVAHCNISCTIILDNILLDFSPTHYRIALLVFQGMEEKREYVPFAQLIECLERQYYTLMSR